MDPGQLPALRGLQEVCREPEVLSGPLKKFRDSGRTEPRVRMKKLQSKGKRPAC